MYSYSLKHKKIGSVVGAFLVIGVVLIIAVAFVLFNFIGYLLQINWITYVCYALLIIGATLIIRSKLQDFTYTIENGIFHIDRSTGSNIKNLMKFRVSDIIWFGDYKELPQEYVNLSKKKMTFRSKESSRAIVYTQPNNKIVIITASEDFYSFLEDRIQKLKDKKREDKSNDQ